MRRFLIFVFCLGLAGYLWSVSGLSNKDAEGSPDPRWQRVSGLTGGGAAHFVAVDPQSLLDTGVYESATRSLCSKSNWCEVAFFRSAAEAPKDQTSADFFGAGGYKHYGVVAIYHKNAKTKLDRLMFNCFVFAGKGPDECMASSRPL